MSLSVVTMVRLFLTVVALVLAVMALSAWNRRRLAPEAPIFALLILSAALYCFGYAGEVAQTTLAGALFWLHVEYLGVPWIPALWLLGARKQHGLSSRNSLLFAVPLMAFAGEQTTPLHGLYDRSIQLIARGPFWVATADRGPIAWLYIAYLNLAILYGAWIYVFHPPASVHRRMQRWVMVASSLVPLGGYLIYLCGWSPWGLDLAPPMLGVTVILGYVAVFRLGCMDLIPMARSLVFHNMRDAVLIVDLRHRLVDFNPAARELLPCLATASPGDDLARVLSKMPALAEALLGPDGVRTLDLEAGGERQQFNVRVFPLLQDKERSGSAAILANVTAQVRMVHELRHSAETDALTGVANRRSFLAALERELARSARHSEPFSVALVDLDCFKAINDQMGHHAGDSVLLAVTARILQCLRASDVLGRYGGDEFAILLPQTDKEGAAKVAERIRTAVANSTLDVDDQAIQLSISLGLATWDAAEGVDRRQLLKRADKALYQAKALGRNRAAAWNGLASSRK